MGRIERAAWKLDITVSERDSQWELAVRHTEFSPVLCGYLEGWEMGGDIGISVAASCGCMTETSTILQSNYIPIKNYQKKNWYKEKEGADKSPVIQKSPVLSFPGSK